MGSFKFVLHDQVMLTMSGEYGLVIGRCEYAHAENAYLVRYVAGDGRQSQEWFDESALSIGAPTTA